MNRVPRIALFGMECGFTATTLSVVLEADAQVTTIFLPGPPHYDGVIAASDRSLPVLGSAVPSSSTVSAVAERHGIAVARVGDLRTQRTQRQILERGVDLVVVACFNRKIPANLYRAVRLGGVNLHPSLLPELRGPDPLFWTFRDGTGRSGITIHRLAGRFDAGPILEQTRVAYPDGCDEAALDRALARIGAKMLVRALPRIVDGSQPEWRQNDELATYASFPTSDDLTVTPDFRARSTFNFSRGIAGRGLTLRFQDGDEHVDIVDALGYHDRNWRSPVHSTEGEIDQLRFRDGVVLARTRRTGEIT